MTRAFITLNTLTDRARATSWVAKAPPGTRVEFKRAKRTLPQSEKMWASLTDIARQLPWHGMHLSAQDWKMIFLDGLNRELRLVPNIDGNGFVNIGRSSSDLSKEEMSQLIELIHAFGAQHGVIFGDEGPTE